MLQRRAINNEKVIAMRSKAQCELLLTHSKAQILNNILENVNEKNELSKRKMHDTSKNSSFALTVSVLILVSVLSLWVASCIVPVMERYDKYQAWNGVSECVLMPGNPIYSKSNLEECTAALVFLKKSILINVIEEMTKRGGELFDRFVGDGIISIVIFVTIVGIIIVSYTKYKIAEMQTHAAVRYSFMDFAAQSVGYIFKTNKNSNNNSTK